MREKSVGEISIPLSEESMREAENFSAVKSYFWFLILHRDALIFKVRDMNQTFNSARSLSRAERFLAHAGNLKMWETLTQISALNQAVYRLCTKAHFQGFIFWISKFASLFQLFKAHFVHLRALWQLAVFITSLQLILILYLCLLEEKVRTIFKSWLSALRIFGWWAGLWKMFSSSLHFVIALR